MKKLTRVSAVVALLVLAGLTVFRTDLLVHPAEATGVVVDRDGKPIEGVRYCLCGFCTPAGDHILIQHGNRRFHLTDKQGKFTIPRPASYKLLDVQFDEEGGPLAVTNGVATKAPLSAHAPLFLYSVEPAHFPRRVVMTPGKVLKGRVVARINDQIPGIGIGEVELQMWLPDFRYESKTHTDRKGEFQFRISPPPKERKGTLEYAGKWVVVWGGETVTIDFPKVTPETVTVIQVELNWDERRPVSAPNAPAAPRKASAGSHE